MKIPDYQKVCEDSLLRLHSIAIRVGISDKPTPSPVVSPVLRELADALILCPDDAAAERALRRYSAGWPGFLFLAQRVGAWLDNGTCSFEGLTDKGVCPYFYLATFVSSFIDSLKHNPND
jgi:hypothetical protein